MKEKEVTAKEFLTISAILSVVLCSIFLAPIIPLMKIHGDALGKYGLSSAIFTLIASVFLMNLLFLKCASVTIKGVYLLFKRWKRKKEKKKDFDSPTDPRYPWWRNAEIARQVCQPPVHIGVWEICTGIKAGNDSQAKEECCG